MDLDVDFLRQLCLCPAPSGFEVAVQDLLRERLQGLARPEGDPLGNLWASVGPAEGPTVAAVAHADQIGLIVTHVEDEGYLRCDAIGWVDAALLPGHTVVVHTARGPVHGVVGRPPTHSIPEAERGKAAPIKEQFIDIGAASRDEALARVAIGDPVTFDQDFVELAAGRYACLAFDDRAGVYAVVRALERYAADPGRARLTVVSSTHEETTFMGARALAYRLQPDCMIVVDGDFASDYPGVDPSKLSGAVKVGGGPVIGRGSTTNAVLTELALEVAAAEAIPVQTKAYAGQMLTDAEELSAAGTTATLALSIPMRYMHSSAEVLAGADVEATAALIAALTKRIGEVFTPGMFVPTHAGR